MRPISSGISTKPRTNRNRRALCNRRSKSRWNGARDADRIRPACAWAPSTSACAGLIYVGQGDEHAEPSTHIDGRAIAAAKRDRRIKAVLARVSEYSVFLLDLRYRIPLPDCRAAFGCSDGLAAWRRRRAFPPMHLVHERGAGTVAHLTPTALELYPVETHHRVDQLGRRLLAAPLPWERDRGEQLRREAERLVLDAYSEYRARLLGLPYAAAAQRSARSPVALTPAPSHPPVALDQSRGRRGELRASCALCASATALLYGPQAAQRTDRPGVQARRVRRPAERRVALAR
jgi:hypothetical protein